MLSRWFTEHPHAIGESYSEHQRHALHFSGALMRASLACFIHALVPGAFEHTASRSVIRLHGEMSRRMARSITPSAEFPEAEILPPPRKGEPVRVHIR